MCKAEFEMMSIPAKKATFVDLFQEVKRIGKGAFGAAYLVKSRLKNEFFIAKKIRFKHDN